MKFCIFGWDSENIRDEIYKQKYYLYILYNACSHYNLYINNYNYL